MASLSHRRALGSLSEAHLHERVLLCRIVQAGAPTASEEIGVNRALHGIAVTEPAQQFADKAARPSLWLEIFRCHACHIGGPFFSDPSRSTSKSLRGE